jgi:cytochrome c oxidase subunit I+III
MFIGFNAAFLPMHLTGLRGMPRRVYTYDGALGWNGLNLVSSVFSFVFAAGVLVVVFDFVRHFRSEARAERNPWHAPSLEWMSGLPGYGFRSLVPVTSRYPLWEQQEIEEDAAAGRGYLPDAPTCEREALVTSPLTGEPEQILRLPGPGWTAFLAAVATAVVFGAMTVKLATLGVAAGVVAVAAYVRWLWSMDRALPREPADAGRGVALPLYRNDHASIGRWGMMVLLVADAAVVASFIFAYLFLWSTQPPLWPPMKSELPTLVAPAAAAAFVVGAYLLFVGADRSIRRDQRGTTGLALIAAAVSAAVALGVGWRSLGGLGSGPTAHAYGATVWTLVGYMGVHVAFGVAMALWCLARLAHGMMDSWRCLTLRVCLLWWRFTAPLTVVVLLLVAGFPHVIG